MTSRVSDGNGWFEIKKNPISKSGVFPYLGRSIGAPDPDKTYMVLRHPDELSDPDTIESFKLLPWIDNHVMLGDPDKEAIPVTPAERKGVEGTTGEQVVFEDGTLFSNIKVFSERLKKLIDDKKQELSAGYRCKWEFKSGNFGGINYDAIQRDIRGNHLALVDEGRMGSEVAVLDSKEECFYFALDSNEEFVMEIDKTEETVKDHDLKAIVTEMVMEVLQSLKDGDDDKVEEKLEVTEVEDTDEKAEDEFGGKKGDESKSKPDYEGKDEAEDMCEDEKKEGEAMDSLDKRLSKLEGNKGLSFADVAAQLAKRDNLVSRLRPVIGSFACDTMDVSGVASYALDKLDIPCPKGHEITAIETYLSAAKTSQVAYSMDSQVDIPQGDSFVDAHYSQEA